MIVVYFFVAWWFKRFNGHDDCSHCVVADDDLDRHNMYLIDLMLVLRYIHDRAQQYP